MVTTHRQFWHDGWIDQGPLKGWDTSFRRMLSDWEVDRVVSLLGKLEGNNIATSDADKVLWKHNKDGNFSVSSAYKRGSLAEERETVDLLEPVSHFLESARVNLAPENLMVSELHKAANFYCVPLQEFTPDAERFDVIWVQWCIGHLADDDFIAFFKRAKVK
ncbi:hypothetical protein MTR67_007495 [Solanum verrucosum]|uniref:Alpha N-terminal protein methyltransferase 1 n=1 Tax=Solanum verrucosum TaxID=315347 RepID=A0AAF0TI93_SOLVR|nr:hypothetical protein MTR67_007495 [Solanum verrucosum]